MGHMYQANVFFPLAWLLDVDNNQIITTPTYKELLWESQLAELG